MTQALSGWTFQRRPWRVLCALLAVALMASGILVAARATSTYAASALSATLGATPVYSGLTCWGGDGGAASVVSYDGVSAWQTDPKPTWPYVDYIYCQVTDAGFPHPQEVTFTVTYWDAASGSAFDVEYGSTSGAYAASELVKLTGTDTWQTHQFVAYDADLAGQENGGASFRIATENQPAGVAVSRIQVAVSDVPPPPALPYQDQVRLGDIFQPGQTPTFNFTATTDKVDYSVYDYDNELVASGSAPATSGAGQITVPGLPDGNYTLVLQADDAGTLSTPTMNAFSVIPKAGPPDPSSPFGAVIHIDQGQDPQFQTLLGDVGITNLRSPGPLPTWSQIETSPGTYDWTTADQDMARLRAQGFSGIVGIDSTPPSFYQGSVMDDPATLQAWVDVSAAFFKRYAGYFPYVATEIANEPDVNGWTAQQYFDVLKPFYTAVKAADPKVQVLGPTGPGIESWTQQLIQLGGLHYLDAWDIHPYRAAPEGIDATVEQIEQWLQQQDGGKPFPIVASEIGWDVSPDSTTPGTATTRAQQAAYYARVMTLLLKAGVQHVWWYEAADEWGTWGLLDGSCCWGSASGPGGYGYYTPHPAYNVAGTVSAELADATYAGTVTVAPSESSQPVQAYQFRHADGGLLDVLWTTGADSTVRVPAPGPVRVVNAMGDAETLSPFHGMVTLSVTADPIYVSGMAGGAILTGGAFGISAPSTAAQGDTVPVKLSVAGGAPTQATYVINGKSYQVSPGSPATAEVPVSTIDGPQTVRAEVWVGGRPVGQVATGFQIGQPVTIKADPEVVSTNPAQLQMSVTLRNNMAADTLDLSSLRWTVGAASGTVTTATDIAANGSHTFTIAMPASVPFYGENTGVFDLAYTAGGRAEQASALARIDFAPVFHTSLGTAWTVSQLQSQPSIAIPDQTLWTGSATPSPVSGDIWLDWDSTYLYMTVQLDQADFTEPNPIDSSWQDDSIQFALAADVPDGTATPLSPYTAFQMALTPSGPQIQRFESALPTQVLTDAGLRITRDSTTQLTTYYLALPWSDIAGITSAQTEIGLTWLTNTTTAGQTGRQGAYQWGGGFFSGSRDPSQFNFIQLMS